MLTFELIKKDPKAECITRQDLLFYCRNLAGMNEIYVNDFFTESGLDHNEDISREQFLEVYPKVMNIRFFRFVGTLIEGYKVKLLNFEDDELQKKLLGQLYFVIKKQMALKAKDLTLTEKELESIDEFFAFEIENQPLEYIQGIY